MSATEKDVPAPVPRGIYVYPWLFVCERHGKRRASPGQLLGGTMSLLYSTVDGSYLRFFFFLNVYLCYKNTDASSPLRTLRRRPASAGEGYFASLPTSIVQVAWWGVRVGSWAGLGGGARRPSGWLDIAGWSCRIDLHLSRAARLGHLAKGRWSGEEGRGAAGRAGAILPIALGVVLARWGGAVGAPRSSQRLSAAPAAIRRPTRSSSPTAAAAGGPTVAPSSLGRWRAGRRRAPRREGGCGARSGASSHGAAA